MTWVEALERTKTKGDPPVPSLTGNNTSLTRSPPIATRPRPRSSREQREHAVAELRAVAPSGHSFGRRG